jgi:hypothetical protein
MLILPSEGANASDPGASRIEPRLFSPKGFHTLLYVALTVSAGAIRSNA